MKLTVPRSGEGWRELLTTPRYNGGDEITGELADLLDTLLDHAPPGLAVGITQDGTPSVLFTFQPAGPGELVVHVSSDGRTPLRDSLDVLTALVEGQPGTRFLAFCRRPALVRLLAGRGWTLQSHEWDPFCALMTCQAPAV